MPRRLTRFKVEGLFDHYDHDIPLNRDARVTAIIGPNGIGKTVCLKLIAALFSKRFILFFTTEFASCEYHFDDGAVVKVLRKLAQPGDSPADAAPYVTIIFQIREPNGTTHESTLSSESLAVRRRSVDVERHLPFLTQMGQDTWIDDRTGQILRSIELADRYGDRLPPSWRTLCADLDTQPLTNILSGTRCRLIETQRLLVMGQAEEDLQYRGRLRTPHEATKLAVEQKSQNLSGQIQKILTQYAALSQSLDRSFPRRILQDYKGDVLDRGDIDAKLSELEARRRALENSGILQKETEPVTAVPAQTDEAIQRVISIYIEDTTQKLRIFEALQKKIQLFEDLIKSRFVDKRIAISKDAGFLVFSFKGQPIPLSTLSSGEQHQLVLIFELLFETVAGDLILVDEPELSLHVAWQKIFITDLLRIIQTNPFDAVLATHSPVLIGHHYSLAVELQGGAQ